MAEHCASAAPFFAAQSGIHTVLDPCPRSRALQRCFRTLGSAPNGQVGSLQILQSDVRAPRIDWRGDYTIGLRLEFARDEDQAAQETAKQRTGRPWRRALQTWGADGRRLVRPPSVLAVRMVLQKLPPLGTLEAFVAVAQRQSLKAAAPELNISVSALSRRIQTLEGHLGLVLFERGAREFRLTAEGSALLESVCASLDLLGDSISSLRPTQRHGVLRVGAPAGFASYWLGPRIGAFRATHPSLETSVDTENLSLARLGSGLHLLVMVGEDGETPSGSQYRVQRLARLKVRALCAPSLLAAAGGRLNVDDVELQTVLAPRSHSDWFAHWRRGVGASARPHRVEYHDSIPVMLEAAANGHGLAIVPELVAQPHIVSGRLVDPFQASIDTRSGYHLVVRQADAEAPAVQRFQSWLMRELARDVSAVAEAEPDWAARGLASQA